MDVDELEVEQLQQIIREKQAAVDEADPGTPTYQAALEAVLAATVELVNHEDGIPVRRRAVYSARTAEIVKLVGVVTAAVTAPAGLLALTPWRSAWWLLLLVPMLAIAALVTMTASAAAPSSRPNRRIAAGIWAAAVTIAVVLVIISPWLSSWLTGVATLLATIGGLGAALELVDVDTAKPTQAGN